MAGFQKRLNDSLQRKLSFWLSAAILLVALLAGVFSYWSAFHDANELQDGTLLQVASLFDRQFLAPHFEATHAQVPALDEETRVVVQHLAEGAHVIGKGDAGPVLPLAADLPDGLQTINIQGEPYRVLVKTTALGERIAAAQEVDVRDDLAENSALRTLIPLLILVPVLLLLVRELVRNMLVPITRLSATLDARAEDDLQSVPEHDLPHEVRPFAAAINRLLARVHQSMQVQRRFVADAAHELRSPMTALSLQAERLQAAPMSHQAEERLADLRLGIERSQQLLEQLLALAKVQSAPQLPQSALSVQQIYRTVLADLLPLAEARQIDIGIDTQEDALVWASEPDVMALVRNLVDNAIRYTPQGGKVDLSVVGGAQQMSLRFRDTGPGIRVEERERVFEDFYRAPGSNQPGSGLGLAIVKAALQRCGGRIELSFADEATASGLQVCVSLPAPPAGRASA